MLAIVFSVFDNVFKEAAGVFWVISKAEVSNLSPGAGSATPCSRFFWLLTNVF